MKLRLRIQSIYFGFNITKYDNKGYIKFDRLDIMVIQFLYDIKQQRF